MFQIKYNIIILEDEDGEIKGTDGQFEIKCNNSVYGDFNLSALDIFHEQIYGWIKRYLRIVKRLQNSDYVVLSDIDSYKTWIEFKKNEDILIISQVDADKPDGSSDIENKLVNLRERRWSETISYLQFEEEVISKSISFVKELKEINSQNTDSGMIRVLEELIKDATRKE